MNGDEVFWGRGNEGRVRPEAHFVLFFSTVYDHQIKIIRRPVDETLRRGPNWDSTNSDVAFVEDNGVPFFTAPHLFDRKGGSSEGNVDLDLGPSCNCAILKNDGGVISFLVVNLL